ncbi:Major facilitator superfamily domain general substrate transporter [Penicillium brevicompactum]|uniref:Major facilitator superfamily domain general substrate transporter n=1 Tax=Penicillium brevicompactum TaxID=5074 RepID=A0A9W9USZ5_PENBR|nr:Major facilitator superfamily domain general substrate transporter [Penicillium brevicompactum]
MAGQRSIAAIRLRLILVGAVLFGTGTTIAFQLLWRLVLFLHPPHGFGFPLFAPYIYNALHYGWGNTLLAFVVKAIEVPAPFFLWNFDKKLRKKSPFAAG